jgi:hypothetical protein
VNGEVMRELIGKPRAATIEGGIDACPDRSNSDVNPRLRCDAAHDRDDYEMDAAYALDRSGDRAQFIGLARRVLEACDACHAEFRAAYESPFDPR